MSSKIAIIFVLMILAPFIIVGGSVGYTYYYFNNDVISQKDVTLIFPKGSAEITIANTLAENKVIRFPRVFMLISQMLKDGKHFKEGEYIFKAGITPIDAYSILLSGDVVQRKITFAEGLTTHTILEKILNTSDLEGTIDIVVKEGDLLPDTFLYTYGSSRNDLVKRMKSRMIEKLDELWKNRADNLPLNNKEEALILASIVEKETGKNDERKRVAAIFVNRLRANMRLQTDPTVIYAVTNGKYKLERPLSKADLEIDSPYNTYKIKGLPVGAIANPGVASIEAALNPLDTKEYYFVANGNGGHNFAKNLKGHNKNVRILRRLEAQK